MSENILLDFKDKKVNFQEVTEIIESYSNKIVSIKNVIVDDDLLNQLELKFEDKLIRYIIWSKILIIGDSITTHFVRNHKDEFLQCFIAFDNKAHEIMNLLATTFNIDLDDSAQLWDLKRHKSNNQRGQINSSWDYYFHGAECAFKNKKTGQQLDIKIIYGREYGVIDDFFLYRFIETTKSLQSQFELLKGESHNLTKVIRVLKRDGYLINRPKHDFEELILNRNKKGDNRV